MDSKYTSSCPVARLFRYSLNGKRAEHISGANRWRGRRLGDDFVSEDNWVQVGGVLVSWIRIRLAGRWASPADLISGGDCNVLWV
jgi:hypothetical protein